MTLAPGWVQEHLTPKGPTVRDINQVSEQWRTGRDAIHCHQWGTAITSLYAVLAFLETAKAQQDARIARKRAAKFARRA